MRVAVLGPGGVGGFLAGALARAALDVVVVARANTARVLATDGIDVRSAVLGDFTVSVAAVDRLDTAVDALIVATKATGLADALSEVTTAPPLTVPLLNGLDHLDALREHFGPARVAAGTIRIESTRVAPGVIVQSSPAARVELASSRESLLPSLQRLAATVRAAGIAVNVVGSEQQIMWSKLVRLNALALTTSASERPLGEIRDNPAWRAVLHDAVVETAAVARADGADIDAAATWAELEHAHAGLRSSMHRDIAAGRAPELDAIAGSVLRAARRHGIPCPTVARLTAQVAARAGIAGP